MKHLKIFLFVVFFGVSAGVFGQPEIIPGAGHIPVPPEQPTSYSVDPDNYSCKKFTWTVTNGRFAFSGGGNVTTVTTDSPTELVYVIWKDTTATGTLTLTASDCNGNTFTTSETYVICSFH